MIGSVNANSDPVVCTLMDFKREEYRKQKLRKAAARRVQKKKEIRLKVTCVVSAAVREREKDRKRKRKRDEATERITIHTRL